MRRDPLERRHITLLELKEKTLVQRSYRVERLPSQRIFGCVQTPAAESTQSRQQTSWISVCPKFRTTKSFISNSWWNVPPRNVGQRRLKKINKYQKLLLECFQRCSLLMRKREQIHSQSSFHSHMQAKCCTVELPQRRAALRHQQAEVDKTQQSTVKIWFWSALFKPILIL